MSLKPTNKFNEEEQIGALIGQVQKDNGAQISTSLYNRYAKRFGSKRVTKMNLEDLIEELNQDASRTTPGPMYRVYRKVVKGKLTLYDVFGGDASQHNFTKAASNTFSTQVVNHQATLDWNRKFRYYRRHGSREQLRVDDTLDKLASSLKDNLKPKHFIPIWSKKNSNRSLIINCSDTHIGATVNVKSAG